MEDISLLIGELSGTFSGTAMKKNYATDIAEYALGELYTD